MVPSPRSSGSATDRLRITGPKSDIVSLVVRQTQYVVVNPPPRYEIVGLLQQRSYMSVNGFPSFWRGADTANSLLRGCSRNNCK